MVMFEPNAWQTGCARLTALQEWTYLQISLHGMDTGKPLPEDEVGFALMRHPGDWKADLDALVAKGKVKLEAGKGYSVERAVQEQKRAAKVIENRRKAARKSVEVRQQKQKPNKQPSSKASRDVQQQEKRREEKIEPNGSLTPNKPPSNRVELPANVDRELWKDFKRHRVKLKAPMTERAERLLLSKLEKIEKDTGQAPNDVLSHAIERGWKGVFAIKNDTQGKQSGWRFDDE